MIDYRDSPRRTARTAHRPERYLIPLPGRVSNGYGTRAHLFALSGALIAALTFCAGANAAGADAGGYSQANRLLFKTDHLANVQPPAKLHYRYDQTGMTDNYTDTIGLTVQKSAPGDNGKQVRVELFSGDRKRFVPVIKHARGNPVVMMFLQNDVSNMEQSIGGNWRFFQNRIKKALANKAKVDSTQATYEGRQIAVQRVAITPFVSSHKHGDDIASALQKRYVFMLSDQVPGGVLEIRADTPGPNGKTASSETLELQSAGDDAAKEKGNAST